MDVKLAECQLQAAERSIGFQKFGDEGMAVASATATKFSGLELPEACLPPGLFEVAPAVTDAALQICDRDGWCRSSKESSLRSSPEEER